MREIMLPVDGRYWPRTSLFSVLRNRLIRTVVAYLVYRISTHDFRRCWVNHLLVEQNVSPRVVMALGGCCSHDAIEPHLFAPTEENIIESMRTALERIDRHCRR